MSLLAAGEGRLSVELPRGRPDAREGYGAGTHPLGLGYERDGLLYVPPSLAHATQPAPLVVLLHGAGSHARTILEAVVANGPGLPALVLAPDARRRTWDAVMGGWGPDVAFIDRALEHVASSIPVDRRRVAVAGFSDGASYALSLGLRNGDLLRRIVAFSPGFATFGEVQGEPEVFVTHGRQDRVLPIDRSSRRIVPQLRAEGVTVHYEEFEGGHAIPAMQADAALAWAIA